MEQPSNGQLNSGHKHLIGTNISGLADWNTEEPLVDVFKFSRPWVAGTQDVWDDGHQLQRDEQGWITKLGPKEVARTLMFTDSSSHRPGRYTVSYEGKGTIQYAGGARHIAGASKPGRDVLEVRPPKGPDTGIVMALTAVDPKDPIRNIRILPPGGVCSNDRSRWCDAQNSCVDASCQLFSEHPDLPMFHPDFLARTKAFGMIRFMDFLATNNSGLRSWEDRPKLTDASWAAAGAPLEAAIVLSNELGVLPWFNIPHLADDGYVRSFAEALRFGLEAKIPIWIEYSNEIWNNSFEQHRYAVAQGEKLGFGKGLAAALRFQAKRSLEIFKIFEEVLGPERVIGVVGSQAANPWVAEQLLAYEGLLEHVDAIAIAPYFGPSIPPEEADLMAKQTVEQLIKTTRKSWLPEALDRVTQYKKLTQKAGLQLVAYEAGQHFVGVRGAENNDQLTSLLQSLNRHPDMKQLYLEYVTGWHEAGGGWFNNFSSCGRWSKWGSWGALEHIRQPRSEAPKYDALLTHIERVSSKQP